jgi:hypothetical protein
MPRKYRGKSNQPKPIKTPPPPANINRSQPSLGGSIMSNIFTGMTFGAGSSLGHRAVDGVMGNRRIEVESNNESKINENNSVSCEKILDTYQMCLKNENNDCSYLQELMKLKCSFIA